MERLNARRADYTDTNDAYYLLERSVLNFL